MGNNPKHESFLDTFAKHSGTLTGLGFLSGIAILVSVPNPDRESIGLVSAAGVLCLIMLSAIESEEIRNQLSRQADQPSSKVRWKAVRLVCFAIAVIACIASSIWRI